MVQSPARDEPPSKPADDLLEAAWGIIANSGVFGNPSTPTEGCREAAERWRDDYHRYLAARG